MTTATAATDVEPTVDNNNMIRRLQQQCSFRLHRGRFRHFSAGIDRHYNKIVVRSWQTMSNRIIFERKPLTNGRNLLFILITIIILLSWTATVQTVRNMSNVDHGEYKSMIVGRSIDQIVLMRNNNNFKV